MPRSVSVFPKHFLWGASTAAHQIEGGTTNNWSEWERTNAERLAKEAPAKYAHWLPNWGEIQAEAATAANYRSGANGDHYNRWKQDVALMKQLGLTAYRFSIEWSRIEPTEGTIDQSAIHHYQQLVAELQKHGITPIICLWHWTVPLWVRDQGEWVAPKTIADFVRFARLIATNFPTVTDWITLNEPDVYAAHGYLIGEWPPQRKNPLAYWRVLHSLIDTHRSAANAIRTQVPGAQVGIAKHMIAFEGCGFTGRLRAALANWWWNRYLLDRVAPASDFIGINYYFHHQIGTNPHSRKPVSDLGWWLSPAGLGIVIDEAARYRKPLMITEHGLADRADRHRAWYIEESLRVLADKLGAGADIRGYLHWSLLDNFEWDKGYWPRFGLAAIDYATKQRRIRPSAHAFSRLIRRYQR